MQRYKIETIEGTEDYVKEELLEKYPDSKIYFRKSGVLKIESEIEDINKFQNIFSAFRISKESDKAGETVNLFRREWRKEFVPAGINPALAYIMCMIADIKKEEVILDPFCGGSTIPLTANIYFDAKKVIASDISGKATKVSQANFDAAKIPKEKYFLLRKGVRDLKMPRESVDKIISNLPFGIRAGTHKMNEMTYLNFKKTSDRLLKSGGTLILLTQEKELLRNTFNDYKILDEIVVNQGGLTPSIFVLKKK